MTEAGRTSQANLGTNPRAMLLWPPIGNGPYSLIVDGTADLGPGDRITVRPERAGPSPIRRGSAVGCVGESHRPQFLDEHLLRIGAVAVPLWLSDRRPASRTRLVVMKPRRLVERYVALCEAEHPKRIVELGIKRGGSTAMLSELTRPERLVAVELADRGRAAAHRLHHRARARRCGAAPLRGGSGGPGAPGRDPRRRAGRCRPSTWSIDDASHRYEPSRASFEVLFPAAAARRHLSCSRTGAGSTATPTGMVESLAARRSPASSAAA